MKEIKAWAYFVLICTIAVFIFLTGALVGIHTTLNSLNPSFPEKSFEPHNMSRSNIAYTCYQKTYSVDCLIVPSIKDNISICIGCSDTMYHYTCPDKLDRCILLGEYKKVN